MRKGAAWLIVGAGVAISTTAVGAAIRGPYADGGVGRDFLAGSAVVGAAMALAWAQRELGIEDDSESAVR